MRMAPIDDTNSGGGYTDPQVSVSVAALDALDTQAAADAQKIAAQQATIAQQSKINSALSTVLASKATAGGNTVAAGDNGLGGLGDIVPGTGQSAQDLLDLGYSGSDINNMYAAGDPSLSASQLDVASSTSGSSMGSASSLINSGRNLGYSIASAITGRPVVNTSAGPTLGNTALVTSSNFTMILLLGAAVIVFVVMSRKG